MKFYQMSQEDALNALQTNIDTGLSADMISERYQIYGKNIAENPLSNNYFSIFVKNIFSDVVNIVLIIAAVISALVSFVNQNYIKLIQAALIFLILIINALIRLAENSKAEKTICNSRMNSMDLISTLRDGTWQGVSADDLVPGDIIRISIGDVVPADGLIITSQSLKTDESVFSGSHFPMDKTAGVVEGDNRTVSDLINMVFSETTVLDGTATVVVTAIGNEAQIRKSAHPEKSEHQRLTPLQMQTSQISKVLSLIILAICGLLFLLGILWKNNVSDMLLLSVALAVAVIPDSLSAMVSVVLAGSVQKLSKQNVLLQNLSGVEKLSDVTVICADKAGTFTQNKMSAEVCLVNGKIIPLDAPNYKESAEIILYGSMCNDAENSETDDPTESAIISTLNHFSLEKSYLDRQYPKMGEIPFDSVRKCKTTVHVIQGHNTAIVKGDPETIYPKCINTEYVNTAKTSGDQLKGQGLRVLAIAVKTMDIIPCALLPEEVEKDLTLIGLIGIRDEIRSDTLTHIEDCKTASIKTVMFTEDHIITAEALAKEYGIFSEGNIALSGEMLSRISDEQLCENIEKYTVFSRISSEQRIRIIKAWQSRGEKVAVTGESVDDIHVFSEADVTCALNVGGSPVIKKISDATLLDNSFATLVNAIKIARGTYNNIRKIVLFLLSCNIGELLFVFFSIIFGLGMPILPLQLLWLNVAVELLPALALGSESARDGLMNRSLLDIKANLITRSAILQVTVQSVYIAVIAVFAFLIGTGLSLHTAEKLSIGQTMAFAVLALGQIFHAYDSRSRHLLSEIGWLSNRKLNASICISIALFLFVLLVPGINTVFAVTSLTALQWTLIVVLGLLPMALCELVKLFQKIKR